MRFNPNVTTLRSGLCYRKSVCRLDVCFVCVLCVCNVGAPTQGVETFGNISSPFCTLAILWPPCKNFTKTVPGDRLKRGKIERCHVRLSHLMTSFLFLKVSFLCAISSTVQNDPRLIFLLVFIVLRYVRLWCSFCSFIAEERTVGRTCWQMFIHGDYTLPLT